nr:hypothetical protein [Butyricimonas hominis]
METVVAEFEHVSASIFDLLCLVIIQSATGFYEIRGNGRQRTISDNVETGNMDSSMFEVRKKVPHSLDIERRLTTCNIDVVNRTNTA